ncbi:MAG: alpha/beta fold hydrolase [Rhodobacteraceae bacterium]|nr:alpha/beta fold hydrolase [Paracoccaceae bacterium]MCP5341420.1 alpha/beta fold hydrolase [Paracoccaceae bacterium]
MARFLIAIVVIAGLAGCEPRGSIVIDPAAAAVGDVETIFVGTTRGADIETGEEFGKARSQNIRYVRLDVSVPPDRELGEIKWPKLGRTPDPRTQFLAVDKEIYPEAVDFRADLARDLTKEARGAREAVVYVHGFNNNFAEGAYRLAQLSHDLGTKGVSVHYSWPSRAHPLAYAYDRDSALFARDGLEDLLRQVEAAGAERMLLVAHSMGAALTMETLRQLAIEKNRSLINKISGVVLISPDIDVDVFRAQATRIGNLPQPFIIFTSKRDHALALSARLTGQHDRLGNVTDIEEVADLKITVLDTTAFSTGAGHFNAGNSPALLLMLGRLSEIDTAFTGDPTGRPGLLPGAVLTLQNATQIILSPVTAISGGTL